MVYTLDVNVILAARHALHERPVKARKTLDSIVLGGEA
jgi:hypothetical protein